MSAPLPIHHHWLCLECHREFNLPTTSVLPDVLRCPHCQGLTVFRSLNTARALAEGWPMQAVLALISAGTFLSRPEQLPRTLELAQPPGLTVAA